MSPPVTLLTDFTAKGPYAASLRGVIASATDRRILDISHDVPRQDVRSGAYVLWAAAPTFPTGTVHCCVVDPGVGTNRRAVAVRSGGHLFVAPDNGLVLPAAAELGEPEVREISPDLLPRREVSRTFHGRDVFAPVAARLAADLSFEEVGPVVADPVRIDLFSTEETPRGTEARVVFVDGFGNVVTGHPAEGGEGIESVEISGAAFEARRAETYGGAEPGELLVIEGSTGLLEIAVNRGSAAELTGASAGDPVVFRKKG